jgi:hypothetical protein
MPPRAHARPTTLRRTVDVVTAMAAIGLIAGMVYSQYDRARALADEQRVADDLERFHQMIQLRAATKDVALNQRGWPITIDPAWFGDDPPRNVLVPPDRPWVEVAPPEDAELGDPELRVSLNSSLASFWYNPYQGIVRARVPLRINDAQTLDLYNRINGTAMASLFVRQRAAPLRTAPAPHAPAPGDTPAPATAAADANAKDATESTPSAPAGAPPQAPAQTPPAAAPPSPAPTQPPR